MKQKPRTAGRPGLKSGMSAMDNAPILLQMGGAGKV